MTPEDLSDVIRSAVRDEVRKLTPEIAKAFGDTLGGNGKIIDVTINNVVLTIDGKDFVETIRREVASVIAGSNSGKPRTATVHLISDHRRR